MHHQEFTSMGPSMFADIPAGGGGGAQKKERASIVPLLVLAKLLVVSDCFLPQPGKQGLINNDYKNKCTGDLEKMI